MLGDTIAAVCTAPGVGAVAIVRVSGPAALSIADSLVRGPGRRPSAWPTHTVRHRRLTSEDGALLDDCLVVVFRQPHSYTGEDVVEFQCHGGFVTPRRVLAAVLERGARSALPGEFTQRAFANGRIGLAEAEAVCDLIRARTEAAQRSAVAQRDGALRNAVGEVRDLLLNALARVEVAIDYADEGHALDTASLAERIASARSYLDRLLALGERGRMLQEGARVAIVGRPNVGKSSLFNALLRSDRAIVTDVSGTTRDTLAETVELDGVPVTLVDTAGLRETEEAVERIGIERAREEARCADAVLVVLDASSGVTEADRHVVDATCARPMVLAVNKVDLTGAADGDRVAASVRSAWPAASVVLVSATTGAGLQCLATELARVLHVVGVPAEEDVFVSRARHLSALRAARGSVVRAAALCGIETEDVVASELRLALEHLGEITGESLTEDLIDRIFRDFCVGK